VILAAASVGSAQFSNPVKPDLAKLPVKESVACQQDAEICKTDDLAAITAELDKRIPSYPTSLLLSCLADWKLCGSGEFTIAEELAHRGKTAPLMDRYWHEPNTGIRRGILLTLTRFHNVAVADFMRRAFAAKKGGEQEMFWAASYLAGTCDPDALQWLSTRKGRLEGCMFYIDLTADFGKCNYRDAIPYIVNYSIRDACLGIDDAGVKDLQHFFPHSRKNFNGMEDMQKYFCGRAKEEGLKVDCDTN
jgi:hypothetical protein